MNDIEIQQITEKLQLELLKLGKLDHEKQKKVESLKEYLNQLQGRKPTEEEQHTLSNSMEDLLTELEISHPTLTNLINQFMIMVGNVGI